MFSKEQCLLRPKLYITEYKYSLRLPFLLQTSYRLELMVISYTSPSFPLAFRVKCLCFRGTLKMTAENDAASAPSNEQVQQVEQELTDLLRRKREIDKQLLQLELQIYNYEGSYLEDTLSHGNIIRGLDGYLSNRSERKRGPIKESDRIFSRSSATYQRAVGIQSKSYDDESGDVSDSSIRRKSRNNDGIYSDFGNSSRKIRLKVVPVNRGSDDEVEI